MVHGSFCEEAQVARASLLPTDNILKVSCLAMWLSTFRRLSLGNNDALAAL